VRFSAVSPEPLDRDAAERVARALAETPGTGAVEDGSSQDDARRSVSAAFVIDVRQAMAEAARDGSRLAKEALRVAGLPDARLVVLALTMRED
jgi:hypothetical protein